MDIDADKLDQAVEEMHDSELGGRRLTVNEARPKGDSAGFGGGGRNSPAGRGGRDRERGGYGGRW